MTLKANATEGMLHHFDVSCQDANGEKWVTVKQLAEALGYANQKPLATLIRRNEAEFKGKTFSIKLMPNTPGAPELIINYHGVIRAAMLSDAPRARGKKSRLTTTRGIRAGNARIHQSIVWDGRPGQPTAGESPHAARLRIYRVVPPV